MWRKWWNRFVASDPSLRRLRTATRCVLAVALTLLAALGVLGALNQPLSGALIGAVVAVQSSVAVNDHTERARLLTTSLMPLPATLSLFLAASTRPLPVVKILVFLVVIFIATYIRRFGPRYFALGFVGFFGYFFAMFLNPTLGRVPGMALAAVCGMIAAVLLRFVLLRDAPQGVLERGGRTLRAQVGALLQAVGELAENPESANRRRAVHDRSTRLNETALMLEETVGQLGDLDEPGRDRLRQRLLDIELAAENLVIRLLRAADHPGGGDSAPRELGPVLRMVRSESAQVRETGRQVADDLEQRGSTETAMTVRRLAAGLAELTAATSELGKPRATPDAHESEAGSEDDDAVHADDSTTDDSAGTEATGLKRPELRTAVQVTVAAGTAVVGGQLISPNRWYWAVITAFVVFISVNSRGELFVRAWQRTAGTLLGVLAGILVASQVTGHITLELAIVLLCVFLAFYFLGYSYAVLTFFITTMLGVLYGILGRFDASVLGTRLAETAVGAVAGVVAASLILPTSTREVVRERTVDFLIRLRDLLRGAGMEADAGAVVGLRQAVRELDDRFHQLRGSARPLTGYRLRSGTGRLDRQLTIAAGCTHYVRNLAVILGPACETIDEDTRHRLAELLWALADSAETLAGAGDREFAETMREVRVHTETLHDIAETLPAGPPSLHRVVNLLDRIGHTLRDLGAELGFEEDPAAAATW